MFSMEHCIAYECNMCGSNHREESDRRPLALCPECLAKVCWATGADPVERFRKLSEFCGAHGLKDERRFYDKSIAVLTEASAMQAAPRSAGVLTRENGREERSQAGAPALQTKDNAKPQTTVASGEEDDASGGRGQGEGRR